MKIGTLAGYRIGGLMLVILLAGCSDQESADAAPMVADGNSGFRQGTQPADVAPGDPQQDGAQQDGAQQALVGLMQIRQEQCQSGNHLACQALPEFPAHTRKLAQLNQACRSGDGQACTSYRTLAETIFTAYSESAAVMRNGEEAMARMNGWRAQMNKNAAASLANLRAQGAAGQAAHEARQQSFDGMNRAWQAGQESSDRTQGRTLDRIYEGTTMDGGGVQARIPYGERGYTDGHGKVITVPEGRAAPDGWQPMRETHAAPD